MFNFDLRDSSFSDRAESLVWWTSLRGWFKEKGYILYEYDKDQDGRPVSAFEGKTQFPYATPVAGPSTNHTFKPPFMTIFHVRTICAQDLQGRHVVIKPVQGEEYKILRFLHEAVDWSDPRKFPCIMSVLELLTYEEHWFAVMPRWGENHTAPWFATCSQVLDAIRCYLRGLAFLHEHRIFHRDLDSQNLYINHFCCIQCLYDNPVRHEFREQGLAKYAIADFNLSIMFDRDTNLRDCRLSWKEAYGIYDMPYEVNYAQLDFNPFAYDVAALGIHFCHVFRHLSSEIPLLAPLLGGMITYDLESRFTAAEALAFLDENQQFLTEQQLSAAPSNKSDHPDAMGLTWHHYNLWSGLPTEHFARWGRYRETKPNIFMRTVVSWLCGRRWGWSLVLRVRHICRSVSFLTSACFLHLCSSKRKKQS